MCQEQLAPSCPDFENIFFRGSDLEDSISDFVESSRIPQSQKTKVILKVLNFDFGLCGILEDVALWNFLFYKVKSPWGSSILKHLLRGFHGHRGRVLAAVLGFSPSEVGVLGDILKNSASGFVESSKSLQSQGGVLEVATSDIFILIVICISSDHQYLILLLCFR